MVQERAAGAEVGSGKKRRSGRSASADIQEVEWQFDAGDLEVVEEWLEEYGSGSGFSVAPGSIKELTDTYLDTEDWRLHRAGYALRVRRKGSNKTSELTMKSLRPASSGGKVRRREISERVRNGDGGFPDLSEARGLVGQRLRALTGSHEVHPLFEIRTRRRTFSLRLELQEDSVEDRNDGDGSSEEIVQDASGNVRRGGDGPRVAEVALDATEIRLNNGEEPARLSRVEVEVEESSAEVSGFVEDMRLALELEPTTASKYEAGLYAAALSPDGDQDLGPDDVDPSMSAGEVAFAILRKQFAAMRAHEPGTRLGEDPEELHDMRVATRRMRAALKLFSGALPEQADFYRNELKWVAGALGEVRDLDVQIEQLETLSSEQEEDSDAFGEVVGALEKRRVEARERMLQALDSDRYDRFVPSYAGMLRRSPEEEEHDEGVANEPIVVVAPDLVSRRYKKWRKAGKDLSEGSPPEEYHEFRKEGKRLRYTLEFLKDVYGEKPTMGLIKPLKELQDGLGRHQDLIVAADLLGNVAAEARRLSSRTAFAMGALSERHLHEAASLRGSMPRSKPYRALVKGKKWEGFEKAMEKRRRSVEKARAKEAGKKK
jgi:CHAD domain-containing protein